MDMRFGDPDRTLAAELPAIDFHVFVATLAAAQASTPAARAAAAVRRHARLNAEAARDEEAGASAAIPARRGAFHGATALAIGLQRSATELKDGFTLAFQPSFKPHA